jgi:hypothetical protein
MASQRRVVRRVTDDLVVHPLGAPAEAAGVLRDLVLADDLGSRRVADADDPRPPPGAAVVLGGRIEGRELIAVHLVRRQDVRTPGQLHRRMGVRIAPAGAVLDRRQEAKLGIGTVRGEIGGVDDQEVPAPVREVAPRSARVHAQRVHEDVASLASALREMARLLLGEELCPLRLRHFLEDTGAGAADVGHDHLRLAHVARAARRGEIEKRAVAVRRIDPEEHLVRLLRRHVRRDEARVDRVAQVEEPNAPDVGGVLGEGAVVDDRAAAEVHDHEELLPRPDAQLARRLPAVLVADELAPELSDQLRMARLGNVDDEHAGVGMPLRPVRSVANVDVVAVDGESGVHAAVVEGVPGDELEVEPRARLAASRSDHDGAPG